MATSSSVSQTHTGIQSSLQPVKRTRYLRGFGNLLRNELQQWWGTRAWWVHLLVWLGLINGFIALIGLAEMLAPEGAAPPQGELANMVFIQLSLIGTGIGAILTGQGSIITEKQLGTAAWTLSKPASRSAFILAKLVAHTLSYLVLAITIPSLVFVAQTALLWGHPPALVPFLLAGTLTIVHLLFYLALTLLLGTVFAKRGPVAGVALGFLLLGSFMRATLPTVAQVMPWMLPDLAAAIAQGQPVPPNAFLPVLGTLVSTILFVGAALWRFNREEF